MYWSDIKVWRKLLVYSTYEIHREKKDKMSGVLNGVSSHKTEKKRKKLLGNTTSTCNMKNFVYAYVCHCDTRVSINCV